MSKLSTNYILKNIAALVSGEGAAQPKESGLNLTTQWSMERFANLRFSSDQLAGLQLTDGHPKLIKRFLKRPNFLHASNDMAQFLCSNKSQLILQHKTTDLDPILSSNYTRYYRGFGIIGLPSYIAPRHPTIWHHPKFREQINSADSNGNHSNKLDVDTIYGFDPSSKDHDIMYTNDDGVYHPWRVTPPTKCLKSFPNYPLKGKNVMIEFEDMYLRHAVLTGMGISNSLVRFVGLHICTTSNRSIKPCDTLSNPLNELAGKIINNITRRLQQLKMKSLFTDLNDKKSLAEITEQIVTLEKLKIEFPNLTLKEKFTALALIVAESLALDGFIMDTQNDPIMALMEDSDIKGWESLWAHLQFLSTHTYRKLSSQAGFMFESPHQVFKWMYREARYQIINSKYFNVLIAALRGEYEDHWKVERIPSIQVTALFEQKIKTDKNTLYIPYTINLHIPQSPLANWYLIREYIDYNSPETSTLFWSTYNVYAALCLADQNKVIITEKIKVKTSQRKSQPRKGERKPSFYSLQIDLDELAKVEVYRKILNPTTPNPRGQQTGHERRLGKVGHRWVREENAHPDEEWIDIKEKELASGIVATYILVPRTIGSGIVKVNGGYSTQPKIKRGKIVAF